jgi:hypothetical protein
MILALVRFDSNSTYNRWFFLHNPLRFQPKLSKLYRKPSPPCYWHWCWILAIRQYSNVYEFYLVFALISPKIYHFKASLTFYGKCLLILEGIFGNYQSFVAFIYIFKKVFLILSAYFLQSFSIFRQIVYYLPSIQFVLYAFLHFFFQFQLILNYDLNYLFYFVHLFIWEAFRSLFYQKPDWTF